MATPFKGERVERVKRWLTPISLLTRTLVPLSTTRHITPLSPLEGGWGVRLFKAYHSPLPFGERLGGEAFQGISLPSPFGEGLGVRLVVGKASSGWG